MAESPSRTFLDQKPRAEVSYTEDLKPVHKDGHEHVKGNAFLVHEDGQIRKIPVPSSNPNDPLNFRRWEKYGVIFCCCWFSIMGLAVAAGLGGILNVFIQMYSPQGYTPDQIAFLITLPTLCIGLGNYIILPLGLAFGRRPVFLVSMVVLFGATIAGAVQNSYEGHLASRIVQGLATGASESLLPLMLTEITFLHERGRIFGLYWMVQNGLSSGINLAMTYINEDMGWRWYYWVFVITVGFGLLVAFFFGFETQFARSPASLDGQLIFTDEFGVTNVIPDDQVQEYFARMRREGLSVPIVDADEANVPRRSYIQKLRPWSPVQKQPVKIMLMTYLHMLQSFFSPGIVYAILTSSVALGCAVGMSLTYATVFTQNYGWKSKNIGLINIGGAMGAVIAMVYCTFLGDKFVLYAAKRNKGIHKPEHHLIVLIPPAIVGFGMLLLYGFTAGGGSSWWAPYMAWTLFQYTFTAVVIVSTTFASDAGSQHPGPALVVVVGTKNIVSFGLTYGLTPMIEKHGYKWAFGVLSGIYSAIFLLGIPVYYLNPMWRARSKKVKV